MQNAKFHMTLALLVILLIAPQAAGQIAAPATVIGKQAATEPNANALGIPTVGQTIGWSAFGPAFDSFVLGTREIDAMAHMRDAYFERLMADDAAMVLSFRTSMGPGMPPIDPLLPGGVPASLWYQEASPYGADTGVWATAPMINPIAPPMQLSAVEVWGTIDDTTHYSWVGDSGGVSIATAAGPYLLTMEIETALGAVEPIDVDALMVLDLADSTELMHPGDYALISVAANGQFDGGEIWLLERAAGGVLTASFFTHSGVTWDTAHDVAGRFGMFPPTDEIDGLEAIVPEPATLALLVLAATTIRRRAAR